jgi:hypothetical protein
VPDLPEGVAIDPTSGAAVDPNAALDATTPDAATPDSTVETTP